MTESEKFKEELPSKEKIYSSLNDRKITDKEYEHVIKAWRKIEMKTMTDYHDLYLRCDVLLLAGVIEKFRNNSLKNYRLCPSNYLSAPGLNWDAMVKMTKIKLELIPDPDMYIFFEKGTSDGISYISNRCCKVNNKYLKFFDRKQESKHIIYSDMNNFYGYAMSKFLPASGFKWIGQVDI